MDIKRYNTVVNTYDQVELVENTDGDLVLYKDVEPLLKELEEAEQKLEDMKKQQIYFEDKIWH